jgi:asparagine synthase (glutamine-hydrolysing)
MLLGQGGGKLVLRRLLARHVPEAAGPAPKQGFAVPVRDWLAGPLRGWVEDLLQPETLRAQGYLRPEAVRRVWRGYLAGRREDYQAVWALAQFQAWLNSQT